MKKQARRKQHKPGSSPTSKRPESVRSSEALSVSSRWLWLAVVIAPVVVLAVALWMKTGVENDTPQPSRDANERLAAATERPPAPAPVNPHAEPPKSPHNLPKKEKPKEEPKSFLDAFNDPGSEKVKKRAGGVATNEELEKDFEELTRLYKQGAALTKRAGTPGALTTEKVVAALLAEHDRLEAQLNEKAASFEQEVKRAVEARKEDPVPRWLTGECLKLVGGEPEGIRPHFEYALRHGLKRTRLLASMAQVQLESNHFAESYQNAVQALDRDSKSQDIWEIFGRVAFSNEKFSEVSKRIDRAFPANPPEWAVTLKETAMKLQTLWEAEQKKRQEDARADDLPRVRFLIEHRRFARDDAQKATVESTGQEEVILELFEDQAPATVANFLTLVSKGFYDGTRFHMVVPVTMAVGGDPKTKNDDPSDDATGVPDYVIPDEFASPAARTHFRGSISMVNIGPHTAFSKFFITLSPQPQMNGHHTVFGRVIKGQEAVDSITRGRTTRQVGPFGKIIPGDLLVRATVLRKRPHKYEVIKQKP
jgi:cyclophilin family peptidyl-prolyl cis-trans isomerase